MDGDEMDGDRARTKAGVSDPAQATAATIAMLDL